MTVVPSRSSRRLVPRYRVLALALLPASALLLPSVLAQSPAPGEPVDEGREDIVVLQVFTVDGTTDRGYLASHALSATKTNTALRDLPVNLSVITEELLTDLNAVNATDALEYSPSLVVQHGGPNLENQIGGINSWQSQIQIRGTGTFFNLRNGFRAYEPPSSVATQRIEIIKGPASVLYGITKPGGAVNFITKKPTLGRSETQVSTSFGSYNRSRVALDHNTGTLLNDKLGIRLIGSYVDTEAFAEFTDSWERAFNPSATYRPFDDTQVSVEFEFVEREAPGPFNIPIFQINAYPRSQVPFYVRPEGPDDPVSQLPALVGLPDNYDEKTSFVGDVQKAINEADKGAITLTQRLGEHLSLNVQFERQRREHGVKGYASTLQAAQLRLLRQYQSVSNWNEVDSTSATLLYQTDLQLPVIGASSHKLVLGVQRQEENYVNTIHREYNAGTNTRTSYFVPLDDKEAIAHAPGERVGTFRMDQLAEENSDFDLGYISYQGTFLDERLLLTAGVTRTVFQQSRVSQTFNAAGPGPVDAIETDAQANSPLLGAIVRPLPWFGIFAQTSKSLNPNTGLRDGFGRPFAPERGDGDEVGIKLDPDKGRLTATVSAFWIKELGRIVNDPNAPNQNSFYLDAEGNPQLIDGPNDPRYDPNLPGQNKGANVAVGEALNQGFEVEAIYSHNRAWQTMASYSYLDAHAVRDNNTNTTNYNGRPLNGTVRHHAAFITKYRFNEGRMKGFDVMLGLRYRGRLFRRAFNSDGTDVLDPTKEIVRNYARGDVSGDLRIGYSTTIWGREANLSLNVGNLFGTERWKGFRPGEPGQLASQPYYYTVGETFTVNAGIKF